MNYLLTYGLLGIKKGVVVDSYTYSNEFFGPVLGIMRAYDLDHALKLTNSLDYGLTGGIHSLDTREQNYWLQKVEVGNAYINRTITGAIVNRQPFGGLKNSSYGRGLKAGGPNYLLQLMNIKEITEPKTASKEFKGILKPVERFILNNFPELHDKWEVSSRDYQESYQEYFMAFRDESKVLGQENFTLYKPHKNIRLFIQEDDSPLDVFRVISAAILCKSSLEIILTPNDLIRLKLEDFNCEGVYISTINSGTFPNYFLSDQDGRNRIINQFPEEWSMEASKKFAFVQAIPVYAIGRLELLHYLKAISVSDNFHRYGNLGNKKH